MLSSIKFYISFLNSAKKFDETLPNKSGDRTVAVTLYRGINSNVQQIGANNKIASVDYSVVSQTATRSLDFILSNGQVMFLQNITEVNISFVIKEVVWV